MAVLKNIAKANAKANTTDSTNGKPVGYVNVTMLGVNIFSRPIWAESTSEVELFAEINELALNDPEELKELFESLFVGNKDIVEIEVSMNRPKPKATMDDLIKALKG
ncbi:hypothetical protein NVP1238A_92 [Vibrio phage 1.238.A._10N.261.52.F10]|uniref:Uncharacterized protein n=2 Tax=Pariacacavirus TaxID=2948856 RepID=A0A2I7RUV5_9CAUD|nr:hypothetical protein KNT79_gp92 [Vibrio phage 1.238.A._10N.261.52.F10]YP_010093536.1 hypothetical protein KNT80_gp93 [Vibrio phage 1.245.O._10N.261.54.C7]AUR97341.1 hypothetical protein NVP1238A_92 [Vibrio phage 1.238.A._10N.261.52.F10]AUR97435.1 hypothetical protein NVP1238B_93 [Vibrio phage 1.238.B._10N.261.52.F10]AUR98006.1 hypothetical protein NVP1245O_93 [Vibrio phage 1.245.O._10N.261.54.C7]